jgi:hypothetical protein
MNLNEKIKEIIHKYDNLINVLYENNINLFVEIELLRELCDSKETIEIYDISNFEKLSNFEKIDNLIFELDNIKDILINEFNNIIKSQRNFLITELDKSMLTEAIKKIRNNDLVIKDKIIEIFRKLFNVMKLKKQTQFGEIKELKNLINEVSEYILSGDKNVINLGVSEKYKRINNEINVLTKKLKKLEDLEEKEKNYESERLEKDKLIKELEFKNKQLQEQLEKENELEKINRAIDKLQVPCDELQKSQDKFRNNRDNFDKNAMDMFAVATVIFGIMTLYLFFCTEINDVSKSVSIGYYLSHSFPILFPTIIGFLFIRQSNVNSKELDKINRRFILIHEVGQSLRALTEINDEKQMNEKTQKIIDKLIENILNYASENNGVMKNEESNILELNERIDKLIDTIDKKLTVIGKPE